MQPNEGIKAWQWIVTVIVIIILIILGYYMFKGGAKTANNATPTTSVSVAPDANEINRVVISDQYPGNIVYISSVQLAKPGFAVVQKDNAGKPGAVIGSMYFDAGINPGKITLTDKTVDGGVYYVTLYNDDGDKKLDITKDAPLKDSNGTVITKVFRATSTATGAGTKE